MERFRSVPQLTHRSPRHTSLPGRAAQFHHPIGRKTIDLVWITPFPLGCGFHATGSVCSKNTASALRKLSSTRAKPPLDPNHNLQVADLLEKLPESPRMGRCVLPLCYGETPYRTALNCNLVAHGPEPHHTWPGRGPVPLCRRDRLGCLDKPIKSFFPPPCRPIYLREYPKEKTVPIRRTAARREPMSNPRRRTDVGNQ